MRPLYICLRCRLAPKPDSSRLGRLFTNAAFSHERPPSTAPKPSINVKHIRENPEIYAQNCRDKNYGELADYPYRIRGLGQRAAKIQYGLRNTLSRIKEIEQEIARLAFSRIASRGLRRQAGETALPPPSTDDTELTALHDHAKRLKAESEPILAERDKCLDEMSRLALALPNLTSSHTPIGDKPTVVDYINYDPHNPPSFTATPSHVSIGTTLQLIDFTCSATSTGWGWYYLINDGAILENALIQYALGVAQRRGWTTVSPPSLVYSHIAAACGFQPRDHNNEQQIWTIEQSKKDKASGKPQRCLTATAEIPLAAMYAGRSIVDARLPLKLVAASRCYRAEAGARGIDTKGLYRVHEFTKVELFAWTDAPSGSSSTSPSAVSTVDSTAVFDEILSIQTEILTNLGLPCRIVEMPSFDLGASAARKRDIEVLFPSRMQAHPRTVPSSSSGAPSAPPSSDDNSDRGWGEVTSASICTDYQSRRLNTPISGHTGQTASKRFPHTVNGTALAVPRVIAAILEHGWDPKVHGVVLPQVLLPYMGEAAKDGILRTRVK